MTKFPQAVKGTFFFLFLCAGPFTYATNRTATSGATLISTYQASACGDTITMNGGNYGSVTLPAHGGAFSCTDNTIVVATVATGQNVQINLVVNGATWLELAGTPWTGVSSCNSSATCNLDLTGFNVNLTATAANKITITNANLAGALFYLGGNNIVMRGGASGPTTDLHSQIAPDVGGWQGQGQGFVFDGVYFHDYVRTNNTVHIECLQVAGTTNMIIRNSKFQNCAVFDLSFTTYNSAGQVIGVQIINNWFAKATDIGGTGTGSGAVHWTATDSLTFNFNSVNDYVWVGREHGPIGSTLTFIGNIADSLQDAENFGQCPPGTKSYNVLASKLSCDSTNVVGANGFVNASGFDYSLAPGAIAINFVPLSQPAPTTDINGNPRPVGAANDAGSVEFGSSTPVIVPDNTTRGVTVGSGWIEATNHHVVRTSGDVVYIVAADDSPCLVSGSGVIRVYKGSGSQALNSLVPTSFSEQDSANHPISPGSGQCQFTGGTGNLLFAPDVRLDSSGLIHIAYIDPVATNNGRVYYQTFNTVTNLWGARTQVATGAETVVGGSWPRGSHCALTLDASAVPYIAWTTGGTSNAVQWAAKTASGGTAFTTPATISGSSGTNEFQPSMVTAIDGSIHLAWIDNALATHSVIKYAKFSGSWSAVETVSSGDANVLGDADHDQMPSVVTDASSRPFVLYNDGVASASDNYIRQRYRTAANTWVDDTAPGGAGGASNPSGTWFNHTSQNYISSTGNVYIFLGHDVNISPGPFSYQLGGPGNNWSAVTQLDPCNATTVTAGEPGCDGSMSIRFDPVRPGRTNLIDLVYYDEDDGSVAGNHHGTIYYKAVQLSASSQASTPTFLPVAGAYTGARSITISTASSGAVICYNITGSPATNGSTGCTTGILYAGPVTVSASQTLFAVAGGTGFTDSTVGSAAYTINPSLKMSGVITMSGSAVVK